jgi:nucleotide-binding universal stress UspA family protein
VTLLHVVPGSLPRGELKSAERDARNGLADEARYLRGKLPSTVRITTVVKAGAAAKQIAAGAHTTKAELIVMGRGGGRALRDAFLGSTAERVLRQAQLPVLVVRLPARAAYSRPALALDLDQAAHEVVDLLLRMVRAPRPRVAVIHAVDVPYQRMVYPSLPAHQAQEYKDELRLKVSQELATLLADSFTGAKEPATDAPYWQTLIQFGPPRLVIQKAVKKAEADLLLLGTHGHTGVAHLFLGTVAGDILRDVACDVLVVPPRQPRD